MNSKYPILILLSCIISTFVFSDSFYFVHRDGSPAKEYVGGKATGTVGTAKRWSSLGDNSIGMNGKRIQTTFNNMMQGETFTLQYRAKGSNNWHTFKGRGGGNNKWHKVVVP